MMHRLGVVPARGGSKAIPRKNLADLGGRPLIAWTVEAARESRVIDRLIVSTDDPEISDVSRGLGAEVPFLRPAELAQDDTPTLPVVLHALDVMTGWSPEIVVLLQPTSPFRSAADIAAAVEILEQKSGESVVSVVESEAHPLWTFRLEVDGLLQRFVDGPQVDRRQDLPVAVRPNGAIYVVRTEVLRRGGDWYGPHAYAYEMPTERSLDIDTPWHLALARLIVADRASARA